MMSKSNQRSDAVDQLGIPEIKKMGTDFIVKTKAVMEAQSKYLLQQAQGNPKILFCVSDESRCIWKAYEEVVMIKMDNQNKKELAVILFNAAKEVKDLLQEAVGNEGQSNVMSDAISNAQVLIDKLGPIVKPTYSSDEESTNSPKAAKDKDTSTDHIRSEPTKMKAV